MTQKTESWKLLIGTGLTLLGLLFLTTIFYELGLNANWIIHNFEIGTPFRLMGIGAGIFFILGGKRGLKEIPESDYLLGDRSMMWFVIFFGSVTLLISSFQPV